MKRVTLVYVVAVSLLCGCSAISDDVIFNHTGGVIEIRLAPKTTWPWTPKVRRLGPGENVKVWRGEEPNGRIVIAAGGCVYDYGRPLPDRAYWPPNASDSLVQYQVEPDLTVWFLPYMAKAIMPVADLARRQSPVRPIAKTCR